MKHPGRKLWKKSHYDFLNAWASENLSRAAAWRKAGLPMGGIDAWWKRNETEALAYVDEIREDARQQAVLTLAEKRAFLASVVRTPIGQVDDASPLCQEISDEEDPATGRSRRRVKMPDKLKAIDLDAKLSGELKPETQPVADALAQIMDQIRNSTPNKERRTEDE